MRRGLGGSISVWEASLHKGDNRNGPATRSNQLGFTASCRLLILSQHAPHGVIIVYPLVCSAFFGIQTQQECYIRIKTLFSTAYLPDYLRLDLPSCITSGRSAPHPSAHLSAQDVSAGRQWMVLHTYRDTFGCVQAR